MFRSRHLWSCNKDFVWGVDILPQCSSLDFRSLAGNYLSPQYEYLQIMDYIRPGETHMLLLF